LEQLKLLASKLDALEFDSNDPQSITSKVTPILNDILLSNLSQKDSQTIEILSDYLADIITRSSAKDLPKLSQALQSVISPAISQEIENNKEKMIDALYPIMGGMISKYVTQSIKEMMESINKKIEDGLSFDRYKRKLKSKLTGVSEVELLLEESSDAHISSLFVIHKETGLLIAQAQDENYEIDDAVMVASMASAIKDFVNDWIKKHNKETLSEVQILSYGNATLYIESAGSVYMVAFMDSEPDYEQRKEIHSFFVSIVKAHMELFHNFNGEMNTQEIIQLEKILKEFLIQRQSNDLNNKNVNFAKYIIYILILFVLSFGIYRGYEQYRIDALENKINKELNVSIKLDKLSKKQIVVNGYINDINQYYKIEKILYSYNYKNIINNLHIPFSKIYHSLDDLNQSLAIQLSKNIKTIEKLSADNKQLIQDNKILLKSINKLEVELNQYKIAKKQLEQISYLMNIKEYILKDLKQKFADSTILYSDGSIVFYNLFEPNSIEYKKDMINLLKKYYIDYITTLYDNQLQLKVIKNIIVKGYSDSSGNAQHNLELSTQRAKKIKVYLESLEITKRYQVSLTYEGLGSKELVFKNGIEDKNASRRISITFQLDKQKILNEIKKLQK